VEVASKVEVACKVEDMVATSEEEDSTVEDSVVEDSTAEEEAPLSRSL
jgi:hypothetical protein